MSTHTNTATGAQLTPDHGWCSHADGICLAVPAPDYDRPAPVPPRRLRDGDTVARRGGTVRTGCVTSGGWHDGQEWAAVVWEDQTTTDERAELLERVEIHTDDRGARVLVPYNAHGIVTGAQNVTGRPDDAGHAVTLYRSGPYATLFAAARGQSWSESVDVDTYAVAPEDADVLGCWVVLATGAPAVVRDGRPVEGPAPVDGVAAARAAVDTARAAVDAATCDGARDDAAWWAVAASEHLYRITGRD